jgi:hypothetical protein
MSMTCAASLQRLVIATNRLAAEFNDGALDTCVLTSHALTHAARRLSHNARPLRVETAVFPDDRKLIATILGAVGRPSSKASSGKWHGHLAVLIDDVWLLDPTLDQANKPEWGVQYRVKPLATRLTEDFWHGRSQMLSVDNCTVRYKLYPRQNGFARAPDARPSHWRPLADLILDWGQNDDDFAIARLDF